MSLLQINNVVKHFATVKAVQGISMNIPQGEICGFLGPNGAGKTTLIRMIMDILQPDEGTIRLAEEVGQDRKSRIGYLPEERGLYAKTEVVETLTYFAMLKGLSKKDAAADVGLLLERLEMTHAIGQQIGKLSKGNQQKIQFIAAVVGRPHLLILDEPFSGLDPVNAQLVSQAVKALRDEGISIVLSTHQMNLAETFCSRIFLFNQGQLILQGKLKEIIDRFSGDHWMLETSRPLQSTEMFRVVEAEESHYKIVLEEPYTVKQLMAWLSEQSFETRSLTPFRVPLSEIFISEVAKHG